MILRFYLSTMEVSGDPPLRRSALDTALWKLPGIAVGSGTSCTPSADSSHCLVAADLDLAAHTELEAVPGVFALPQYSARLDPLSVLQKTRLQGKLQEIGVPYVEDEPVKALLRRIGSHFDRDFLLDHAVPNRDAWTDLSEERSNGEKQAVEKGGPTPA